MNIAPTPYVRSRLTYAALSLILSASLWTTQSQAQSTSTTLDVSDWPGVVAAADGQSVYWNAWGGDPRINAYIAWVGDQVDAQYGIDLVHVKLADTADAVSRVVAEKSAGNEDAGAVDLIWINGENFASMKANDLLYTPWAEELPNFALTDADAHPEVREDFTVPVEGLESPWGKAQITFYHDSERVEQPPRSIPELLTWAKANPGRFTYPLVPDFLGSTFLKQALLGLLDDTAPLYEPMDSDNFDEITEPLWAYLDELHPHLWRKARAFPDSGTQMEQLMGDGELALAFTFSPSGPAAAVASQQLPPSIRSYALDAGVVGNVHFQTIPFNASHPAGAMVVANYLLSPEAQAHKQDINVYGDATVLAVDKLDDDQRALFDALETSDSALPVEALGKTLPEPHPSWMEQLEKVWNDRYGVS